MHIHTEIEISLHICMYVYIDRYENPCEPCSKCLTSWHQIRKCLRHCFHFAYARTSFAYAHILYYAEFKLACDH